jgi:hypothetical protein
MLHCTKVYRFLLLSIVDAGQEALRPPVGASDKLIGQLSARFP